MTYTYPITRQHTENLEIITIGNKSNEAYEHLMTQVVSKFPFRFLRTCESNLSTRKIEDDAACCQPMLRATAVPLTAKVFF